MIPIRPLSRVLATLAFVLAAPAVRAEVHLTCAPGPMVFDETSFASFGDGPVSERSIRRIADRIQELGCRGEIALRGPIGPADAVAMRAVAVYWGRIASARTVEMGSPGGLVAAGMMIGDTLFEAGAHAVVVGDCLSSCVLAYAGAAHRTVAPGGRLGVHRPFARELQPLAGAEALSARYDTVSDAIDAYLGKYGVSPEAMALFRSIPSSGMRYIEPAELRDFGLADNVARVELARQNITARCGEAVYAAYLQYQRGVYGPGRQRCEAMATPAGMGAAP
ncbi:MAG: hypothetical protein GVY28_05385 [Alphaproteobacteria bacterium]|nr:hypothetical protein [Alphaproteobacteria bacterium]